jgi:hypothetical protein
LSTSVFTEKYPENEKFVGFSSTTTVFSLCKKCGKLFTKFTDNSCAEAKGFVNFEGQIVTCHTADPFFSFDSFFTSLKDIPPKDIFWSLWSLLHNFECKKCESQFCGNDLSECLYHPEDPKFEGNTGIYPCCQAATMRFSIQRPTPGCKKTEHDPVDANEVYHLVKNHH